MAKDRIQLQDSTLDILMKMTEGNPGALTVCMRLIKEGGAIDPQSFAGGLGAILGMDSHGIYGSRIWVLYKDVCGENLETMIAVLRGCQMGIITEATLLHAVGNYGQGVDVPAVVSAVKERLPQFGIKEAIADSVTDLVMRGEER